MAYVSQWTPCHHPGGPKMYRSVPESSERQCSRRGTVVRASDGMVLQESAGVASSRLTPLERYGIPQRSALGLVSRR